ncbi:hypothetical protein [Jatrophihabitans sp.]|uniref:hypothetical protein n=1 Tax=Jatrophihabitans sp. TaxID=1932789 RepID=UPI0030C77522
MSRRVTRRIYLPHGGSAGGGRLCLPVEEIDYLWECGAGDYRWNIGDLCDFTELAEQAACLYGCDCSDTPPLKQVHQHPLSAARLADDGCPLTWTDLDQYDVDPTEAARIWSSEIAPLIRDARARILEQPGMLFTDPTTRARYAQEILSVAGHAHHLDAPPPDPIEVVLSLIATDPSVRAATADLGAVHLARDLEGFGTLATALDHYLDSDYRLRHPDELQYLFFPSSQATGQTLELLGIYAVTNLTYRSVFDLDPTGWPWCLGWREILQRAI